VAVQTFATLRGWVGSERLNQSHTRNYACSCPFESEVRKGVCGMGVRTSDSGH
jgi:hypothetical protein